MEGGGLRVCFHFAISHRENKCTVEALLVGTSLIRVPLVSQISLLIKDTSVLWTNFVVFHRTLNKSDSDIEGFYVTSVWNTQLKQFYSNPILNIY